MISTKEGIPPANWQVTATTIRCDFIDDFATLLVKNDWVAKCVWYNRYKQKAIEGKKQSFDKRIQLKIEKCAGPTCRYVTEYRDKLIQEESGGKSSP